MARQTTSYLRELFARHGIAPQHRYGQNFLIDLNIHDTIVRDAEITMDDVILEVGPGAGALTARMAELAAAVVAVEIDPAMAKLTAEATAEFNNVRVLNVDALAGKHRIAPELIDNVRSGLAGAPGRRLKMVANLPFHIATPLITNLLLEVDADVTPSLMVVTIQKEVGERLLAGPQTAAYGSLAATVQAVADVELLRILPPSVFWPQPKIDSAVLKIAPNPEKAARIADIPWFHDVVRKLFLHRRKNLRGVLYVFWRDRWTKPEVDAFLATLGLEGQLRAEAMSVEELIDLAEALRLSVGPGAGRPNAAND